MAGDERTRRGRDNRSGPHPAATAEDGLIWGIHPVLEALETRPGHIHEVVVLKARGGPKINRIKELARRQGVRLRVGERVPAGVPAGQTHQGVAARMTPLATIAFDALLRRVATVSQPPFLLAADSILDPYNLGAIIRSAVAAGIQGVILPKDRSAPLSGTVAKAAAGALVHVALSRVTNLAAAIQTMQKAGIWVYALTKAADRTIYGADLTGPVCLVVGGEEKGVRPRIREVCDGRLTIPMQGTLDSLNASAAAAVALFEATRQRQGSDECP